MRMRRSAAPSRVTGGQPPLKRIKFGTPFVNRSDISEQTACVRKVPSSTNKDDGVSVLRVILPTQCMDAQKLFLCRFTYMGCQGKIVYYRGSHPGLGNFKCFDQTRMAPVHVYYIYDRLVCPRN